MEHIILLGNDPGTQRSLEIILISAGFAITSLDRPEELSTLLASAGRDHPSDRIDLVFMIVGQPYHRSGLELLAELECRSPGVPVLVADDGRSGEWSPRDTQPSRVRVISRPFRPGQVIEEVNLALGKIG